MFQRNIDIIQQRWPYLAEQILRTSLPERVEVVSEAPESTLIINGIQLSSRYDRLCEANLQASVVPNGSGEIYVYGLATGDLPRVLLQRSDLFQLNIIVMNRAVAKASLENLDHSDWLSDPRVNLMFAVADDELQLPFVCAPATLFLADEASARLRDQLFLELSTPFINRKHSERNLELQLRIDKNRDFWTKDQDVCALWRNQLTKPVVIAAAGPTLLDQYGWMLEQREHYQLIAVDAAVRDLGRMGLYPDCVFSIDSYPHLYELFYAELEIEKYADASLIYFPQIDRNILKNWPGPRFLGYSRQQLFDPVQKIRPGNCLFTAGSVIHPAVDIAVKQGAREIYFCGADFAFTKGACRVDYVGVADAPPTMQGYWVINGRGKRVATGLAYRGYLRDLERYIAWYPKISFINCSSAGAKIAGTKLLDGGPRWQK